MGGDQIPARHATEVEGRMIKETNSLESPLNSVYSLTNYRPMCRRTDCCQRGEHNTKYERKVSNGCLVVFDLPQDIKANAEASSLSLILNTPSLRLVCACLCANSQCHVSPVHSFLGFEKKTITAARSGARRKDKKDGFHFFSQPWVH